MKQLFCKAGKFSILFLFVGLITLSCKKEVRSSGEDVSVSGSRVNKHMKDFQQVNLVGNNDEYSPVHIDPLLINAWGITFTANGIAWVGAQGGHVSTVYDREGNTIRPAVNIPSPGGPTGGNPTGVVTNPSATDFQLSNGGAARFLFVGVDGIISGWNPAAGNNALVVKNNVATSVYTGATIAMLNGANHFYAADFRAGRIDVYNKDWGSVMLPFSDPDLPAGYSPFNIQNIENQLYVMYAKVGPDGHSTAHSGDGFVDIFNSDGSLVKRLISHGQLNAPWGVAKAPAGFFDDASQANTILVGNFGDGRINAFDSDGKFLGQLRAHGQPIIIEGLWAIMFPPSTSTINPNRLYFAAGPDEEEEGLFGYITKMGE